MDLNFPNSPTTNDVYTKDGYTWVYDGTKWNVLENKQPFDANLLTVANANNGTGGLFLTTDGSSLSWDVAAVTVSSDNSTAADLYPLFTSTTAGTITTANVSDSKLKYNPNTGSLQATNGLFSGEVVGHINTNAQSASYSILASDDGNLIEINSASANNLTIPLNSSQALPIGSQITILQTGAGQTTIVPTVVTTKTYSSGGALGATTFLVTAGTGILAGQLVTGTGIAPNTYVVSLSTNTVTISQATTAQVAGTITFSIPVFATPGLKLRGQWSSATLIKRTADSKTSTNYPNDTWVVLGDLA